MRGSQPDSNATMEQEGVAFYQLAQPISVDGRTRDAAQSAP